MLFKITPDKHVIRALIQFWDQDRDVFAFKNFELTPTLEEIRYFTSLKYLGRDIGNGPEREIPEYQEWLREDRNSKSPEGEQGFEDIGTTIWIRHSRLGTKIVTLEMWAQMETIMQYLNNAGAGLSNVRASFSFPPPA
ncbi:hypothetical protein H5410_015048 [Solanum commersonii]|uniref:DUF7745 domain-containing protein n=1 Tax=Solanum commersonii TaxID=4109 RepID=A0A9J5ZSR0_SOLCO|nr:hypothetical protein H5410_015048 [Solanum commersonii]